MAGEESARPVMVTITIHSLHSQFADILKEQSFHIHMSIGQWLSKKKKRIATLQSPMPKINCNDLHRIYVHVPATEDPPPSQMAPLDERASPTFSRKLSLLFFFLSDLSSCCTSSAGHSRSSRTMLSRVSTVPPSRLKLSSWSVPSSWLRPAAAISIAVEFPWKKRGKRVKAKDERRDGGRRMERGRQEKRTNQKAKHSR